MFKKNDIAELEITSVTNLGYGTGRCEREPVVFVPGTVTGERVLAKIIKVCKDYCVGKLISIISESPLREKNQFCSALVSCGGCPYRFLTYEEELRLKRENVISEFKKVGLNFANVMPVEYVKDENGLPVIYQYRNKAQYRFYRNNKGTGAGFYASGTHRITGTHICPLQPSIYSDIVGTICGFADKYSSILSIYDEETGKGLLRHIYIRSSHDLSEICVCLIINGSTLPKAEELIGQLTSKYSSIVGIVLNRNVSNSNVILGDEYSILYGCDSITDCFMGLKLQVSMASFYQINHDAAERLCSIASNLIQHNCTMEGKRFVDLYCGIGTIGLSLAKKARSLLGVEIIPEAVENAKRNAVMNGFNNAVFFCERSEEGLKEELHVLSSNDIVCVDPPRKGCSLDLLESITKSKATLVLYISCNPATLARDVAFLVRNGWQYSDIYPVDLFPRTGHVESVVLITRAGS